MPQNRVPAGKVRVRTHYRNLPTPRGGKKISGWSIAGIVAAVWLWGQLVGFDTGSHEQQPASSETSVSESADS